MRIIKEITHPVYKVSIFVNDGRHHVKIQDQRIAVTYTLTEDQCENVNEVEDWIEKDVIERTSKVFPELSDIAVSALRQCIEEEDDEEIEII